MTLRMSSGLILCWGGGEHGQSGHEKKHVRSGFESVIQNISPSEDHLIACGASHSVVCASEKLMVWGNGTQGQLGTGNLNNQMKPLEYFVPIDADDSIVGVTCGAQHSIIWTQNGACYGFGSNAHHQLALSTKSDTHYIETQSLVVPLKEIGHNEVVQVACGERHTLFLYSCGTVAVVGANSHGQLGTGNHQSSTEVTVLSNLEHVAMIACGANHSLVITESGDLYVWGYGKALGYRHKDIVIPTKKVSHYTNLIQIAGGATHSLGLTENGNVYSWGAGADGQLGHGPDLDFIMQPTKLSQDSIHERMCQVAAGDFYSAALAVSGSVYVWGKHPDLSLEQSSTPSQFIPVRIDLGNITVKSLSCGLWHMACVTGTPKPDTSRRSISSRLSARGEMMFSETPRFDEDGLPVSSSVFSIERDRTTLADFYTSDSESDDKMIGLTVLGAPTYPAIPESPRASPGGESAHQRSTPPAPETPPVIKLPEIVISRRSQSNPLPPPFSKTPTKVSEFDKTSTPSRCDDTMSTTSTVDTHTTTIKRRTPRQRGKQKIQFSVDSPSVKSMGEHGKRRNSRADGNHDTPVTITQPTVSDYDLPLAAAQPPSGWNPHRGNAFAELVNDPPNGLALPQLTQKNMGFVPMGDIKLVNARHNSNPLQNAQVSRNKVSQNRHSNLFAKELLLRNQKIDARNTYKTSSPRSMYDSSSDLQNTSPSVARQGTIMFDAPTKPGPKASRRSQVNHRNTQKTDGNNLSAPSVLAALRRAPTMYPGQYNSAPNLMPAPMTLPRERTQFLGVKRAGTFLKPPVHLEHRLTPDFKLPVTHTKLA